VNFCTSLCKNTTGIQQPYFIARVNGGIATTPGELKYNLTLVQTGIILNGQIIGYGQAIQPPKCPVFSIQSTGLGILGFDFYFAVIGTLWATYLANTGLTIGARNY
jgi:hypothetical protein